MAPLAEPIADSRRYDLDWLRFGAFALLIFYHIGMFYVTWGWHVKSVYASPAAEPLMSLLNPWRLALLFFISGVAVRFASDKLTGSALAGSRLKRLGLPILFGMTVLVTPQTYFELVQNDTIAPGYWDFYADYIVPLGPWGVITPTWNHLWYVVYLLAYILVVAIMLKPLRAFAEGRGGAWFGALLGHPLRLLGVLPVPFLLWGVLLGEAFPVTNAFFDDWFNHATRFTTFLIGYFAAKNARFWESVARARWLAAAIVAIGGGLLLASYLIADWNENYAEYRELWFAIGTVYAWAAIVLLLNLAQRLLNRPSRALRYLTEAIFPYYILHQTIIVIAGFYLTQLALGAWPEFLLLALTTVGGCVLLHEYAIRRIGWLRPLFGLKPAKRAAPVSAVACTS